MSKRRPYIIGLTGNIATGKSEVCALLQRQGAYIIDADRLVHQLLRRGTPVYDAVVQAFGQNILRPDGEIDRPALGRIVFADPARLARLESLIHPAVRRLVEEEIAHTAARVVVIDAIKLLESSMAALCDTIWVVTAPEEQQLARLTAKRGMAKHDALLRIRAQPPQEEKIRHAQVVIRNDGSLEELERSVLAAWAQVSAATSDTPMDPT